MKMNRFHALEEDPSGRRTLTSGSRNDAICPPSFVRDHRSMFLEESEPHRLDPDVSLDYISLQAEDNALVAISGSNTEASFNCLSKPAPDPNPAAYAPEGQEEYQRENWNNNAWEIHTPEQDTSPHSSLEQGNSTCIATSESTQESQKKYIRQTLFLHPEMAAYATRINSFGIHHWVPRGKPTVELLAKAGMFYEGPVSYESVIIYDQTVCFKCGQTIREWKSGDIPLEEHKKINNDCFLTKWEEEP